MKSRNRKIEDLYLTLRNLIFGSLRSFTKTYAKEDLLDINIKNILIIRLDRIGDMVMTTPIFRALKEKWPNVQITVLANSVNKNLVINNPFVDCIIVYDKEKRHKSLNSRLSFFKGIRERNFDIVIDPYLDYELYTSIITRLVGSKYRLGFEFAGRGIFYNIRYSSKFFPIFTEKKHMIDYYLDLITCLGIEAKERQPEIFLSSDEKENALQLLKNKGIKLKNKIIGIHPGGNYESQRWPIERFAAISDYLVARYSTNVILFGGRDERHLISEFKDYAVKTPIILEDLNLREFISVLSRCNLFLCNNSGPLHIATALGIPTVSTMGPTVPFHWWPRGKNHVVLRKDLDCSPCKKGICETHECMKLITTNDFSAAVKMQIEILNLFPSEKVSNYSTTNKSSHSIK
ncbi:MAG: heptosyl transferase I [Candidatus Scalindua rubra]|uniref:Heptosyl transferase I n=1 Tax=Candidatus Scalindua rubra TaxID=1872076 RepID=A0A1E3XEU4_9BACT|nr:MAG: heptosyl transferase I [Candidatus Scalindua rubra]